MPLPFELDIVVDVTDWGRLGFDLGLRFRVKDEA